MPKGEQPEQQTGITVKGGTGNTIFINQGHLSSKASFQWYQQEMLKHGVWYWVMHGIVALIVIVLWEGRHWFLGLLK